MKKILLLALILFSFVASAQQNEVGHYKEQSFTYDVSGGNKTFTTKNFIGFTGLSFQFVATTLDQATATVQIQKTNDGSNYLNIVGAVVTLPSGTSTNFINISGVKNEFYRAVITVNTVTSGTLDIDLTATR